MVNKTTVESEGETQGEKRIAKDGGGGHLQGGGEMPTERVVALLATHRPMFFRGTALGIWANA